MKPLDRFYKNPGMKDGRLNKCKECTKADVRKNRAEKVEYYRAYDRERGNRQSAEYSKRWRERNPVAYKAKNAVNNAIRDGRLRKSVKCERCNAGGRLHGHHDDYSKPLDVMWLCVPCHKLRHKELGWGYIWNAGIEHAD